jgi:hypothetical protein
MLVILILVLSGNWIWAVCAYWLPWCCTMSSDFLAYMAIPPLFPFYLLCSMILYPGMLGCMSAGGIHISWMHMISTLCFNINRYALNRLKPFILIEPIVMPCCVHLCIRCFLYFLYLMDPVHLFLFLFPLGSLVGCCIE